jgi:hypothetical protein
LAPAQASGPERVAQTARRDIIIIGGALTTAALVCWLEASRAAGPIPGATRLPPQSKERAI